MTNNSWGKISIGYNHNGLYFTHNIFKSFSYAIGASEFLCQNDWNFSRGSETTEKITRFTTRWGFMYSIEFNNHLNINFASHFIYTPIILTQRLHKENDKIVKFNDYQIGYDIVPEFELFPFNSNDFSIIFQLGIEFIYEYIKYIGWDSDLQSYKVRNYHYWKDINWPKKSVHNEINYPSSSLEGALYYLIGFRLYL